MDNAENKTSAEDAQPQPYVPDAKAGLRAILSEANHNYSACYGIDYLRKLNEEPVCDQAPSLQDRNAGIALAKAFIDSPADPVKELVTQMLDGSKDVRIGILEDKVKKLLLYLETIAAQAGNLPDSQWTSRTGENDAVHRGQVVINMKDIANEAIAKAKGEG